MLAQHKGDGVFAYAGETVKPLLWCYVEITTPPFLHPTQEDAREAAIAAFELSPEATPATE